MTANLTVNWGSVSLRSFSLVAPKSPLSLAVTCEGKTIPSTSESINGKTTITFNDQVVMRSGEALRIDLKF